MATNDVHETLRALFSELTEGAPRGNAFILNGGDLGLLRSLDALNASDASHSIDGGATIAAHAEHTRYGLSLMNRWATEGGNPFASARWDEAWKISTVDESRWQEIRGGLARETRQWLETLGTPRDVAPVELSGMIASVAHVAYHLGAMRQIAKRARGPKEGTPA